MIGRGDEVRRFEDIAKPDPRHEGLESSFLPGSHRDGLKWFAQTATVLALPDSVPDDIRVQWNTACNLLIYAWHVFRFFHIAELQALATLEYGLRDRLGITGHKNRGLERLLRQAIARQLVFDEDLSAHRRRLEAQQKWDNELTSWPEPFRTAFAASARPAPTDPQEWMHRLATVLPRWRNTLAHGSSWLYVERDARVELCRDILVAIYTRRETNQSPIT